MPQRLKRRSEINLEDSPESTRQRREDSSEVSDTGGFDVLSENATTSGPPPVDQMVKKLVRLALATEFTRQPLRRADVSTKVLGPHNRMFKAVFTATQKALQERFGMKLVELPSKEKVTITQKRAAQRAGASLSQGGSASSSKSWILSSTLPSHLRSAAILGPTKNPNATGEGEYIGLYSFVVSLIYLSQGSRISEGKLEQYLGRCRAADYVAGEKTDNVLKKMEKQGYIVKVREREPGGEETIDWILGPRGRVEIGEKGVAGMVRTVYDVKDAEMSALEDQLEQSLGEGTFRRKTKRAGATAEGEDAEDAQEDGEEQASTQSTQPRRSGRGQADATPARRSNARRRSSMIDDAAEENEEEDEDEDEEQEDEEDE